MKKLRLKKEVKGLMVLVAVFTLIFVSVFTNLDNVTKDELGNTCRGGLVKICSNEGWYENWYIV